MAKFYVRVKEIHESIIEVDAASSFDALKKVYDDLGAGMYPDDLCTEYQRTLPKEEWIVEDEHGNITCDDGLTHSDGSKDKGI